LCPMAWSFTLSGKHIRTSLPLNLLLFNPTSFIPRQLLLVSDTLLLLNYPHAS
jgi:hypothetical protein